MKSSDQTGEKTDAVAAFFFISSNIMNFADSRIGPKGEKVMHSLVLRQKMALFVIEFKTRTEKNGITLKTIAQTLNIPLSSASLLVESLVQKGLCLRTMNPDNRRRVDITLSEFGSKMLKIIIARFEKRFKELQAGLSQNEIDIFEKVIIHYYQQLVKE